MFKKLLYLSLGIVILFQIEYAKKEKTVKVKDHVAVDQKYGWKLPIPDNWKAKGHNEPDVERLFLEKKNYQVNPYVREYGGNYTIPRIMIYEEDFAGTLDDFENLLKKSLEEHRSDNDIITKMGLLKDGDFIVSADVELGPRTLRQIYVKKNYRRMLYIPDAGGGSGQEEYRNDHEVHEIYLLKKDGQILVFQAYSEREFYDANSLEFQKMMSSLEY